MWWLPLAVFWLWVLVITVPDTDDLGEERGGLGLRVSEMGKHSKSTQSVQQLAKRLKREG